jgi:hypothetical protein
MDRDGMNDSQASAALKTRELTEAELDVVSGGCRKAGGGQEAAVDAFSSIGGGVGKLLVVIA